MKLYILLSATLFAFCLLADNTSDIAKLIEGRFDNNYQVLYEDSTNAENPHERIHTIIKKIENSPITEHILYTEQYGNNDPAKVYRQRLYGFTPERDGSVRLTLYKLNEPKKYLGAQNNPELLQAITTEDVSAIDGCHLIFNKTEEAFEGRTIDNACNITLPNGTAMNVSTYIKISKSELLIYDEAFTPDGKRIWGRDDKDPHLLWRAREFNCWAAIKKEDNSGYTLDKINTHDQGGKLIARNGEKFFTIELSQVIYGSGTQVLKLGVHKADEKKTKAYIWGEPTATRLGVNLGWIQASCTMAK